MFVFWRWLWTALAEIKQRGERTGAIVQEINLEQTRHGERLNHMRNDLDNLRSDVDGLKGHLLGRGDPPAREGGESGGKGHE